MIVGVGVGEGVCTFGLDVIGPVGTCVWVWVFVGGDVVAAAA